MAIVHLRILETTDIHMDLTGFDFVTGQQVATRGLANLAPVIAAAQAEAPQSLLFDNGDFLQGNPLADQIAAQQSSDRTHPMIAAFNTLSYDAIAPGNHEFDYGLDFLTSSVAAADMPVLCSNLRTGPQTTLFAPWTILTRDVQSDDGDIHVLRVGVIGFVTPPTVEWGAHLLQGKVQSDDIVAAARTYLPQLKRGGADIGIALCHAGISDQTPHDRMEDAALPLAQLPGIDVVLTGHTHDTFPGPDLENVANADSNAGTLFGKPAVMAAAYGSALGVIDLDLAVGPEGWSITDHRCEIRWPDPDAGSHPVGETIVASVRDAQNRTFAAQQDVITTTPRRLTSYFAPIGRDDTAPLMANALVSSVRSALAETEYADLPVIAATTTFQAGGKAGPTNYLDLAPGRITRAHTSAIAPFDNPLCAVLQRGWQLRRWLEHSSAYFNTISDSSDPQPLVRAATAHYHFDTLHGLRYRIDLRIPPRLVDPDPGQPNRVRDVTFDGKPLQDDALFVVATSSYRAHGGGGLVSAASGDVIHTSALGMARTLADHLTNTPIDQVPPVRPWQFVPVPGAVTTFLSAPRAIDALPTDLDPFTVTMGDVDAAGFQTFALHL